VGNDCVINVTRLAILPEIFKMKAVIICGSSEYDISKPGRRGALLKFGITYIGCGVTRLVKFLCQDFYIFRVLIV
jgi:hypothetical protein